MREKRRHDAIVEAGWRIVRVTKEDLRGRHPARRRPRCSPRDATGLRPRRDADGDARAGANS